MIVEIISTGTELLLGQILNTNAAFLSQRLNELGFDVLFQTTVGDNRERMASVLNTALTRADIIITSGGLGPTQGDITKEVTAKVLNLPMQLHEPSAAKIKAYFAKRNAAMPESNLRQAMMPQGAIVIDNERGTAPGVILEVNSKTIIHLPGPPYELEGMFEQSIIPYLRKRFGLQGAIVSKVLRTYGIGESALEEKIRPLIMAQSNPTLALLVRNGEVHIRLTAKGQQDITAQELIAGLEGQIRQLIGEYIFGVDDETLEMSLGQVLREKKLTIALAESCTGGLVSSRITDIAGSSEYLIGSVVCYSNAIKTKSIGVPAEVLDKHGAVSRETAMLMASGIRTAFVSHLGVGITGIAGPGGATHHKPVGLVYIAVDGPKGVRCVEHRFTGHRTGIKQRAALAAMMQLRQYALSL